MDNHPDISENPYAAPPITADPAMGTSPFAADLTQAEQIRCENISREAEIRAIGLLYYVCAGICGIGAFSVAFFELLPLLRSSRPQIAVAPNRLLLFGVIFVIYILLSGLLFFTARGLRRFQPWSRISSGIISGFGLLAFPIGTLINACFLYLLLSSKANIVFSPEYREIITRTPHIKNHTSRLVKILAILLLALLAISILAAIIAG